MLSDRHRWLKVVLALAFVIALCALAFQQSGTNVRRYPHYLASPQTYDGQPLSCALWVVERIESPTEYSIRKLRTTIPLVGDTRGLSPGDTVSIVGDFRASDLKLVVTERWDHPLYFLKKWIGVLGVLVGLFLLPRHFAWRQGEGLVERG